MFQKKAFISTPGARPTLRVCGVFVTFPFSSPHDPMNCEYVAEVVRVEKLLNSKLGVAVHLMMTVNYGSGARRSSISGV